GVGRCARGELSGAVSQRTPSPARSSVATTATVSRRRWEREVLSEVISMSSSLGPVPGRHLPCAGETPPPSTGPLCIYWRHTRSGCACSALCTHTARTTSGRVVAYLPAGHEGPAAVIGGRLTRP